MVQPVRHAHHRHIIEAPPALVMLQHGIRADIEPHLLPFVDNLFDKKYYNSFIEKTTLENVFGPGPLASDLGVSGDRRRYGVRTRFKI